MGNGLRQIFRAPGKVIVCTALVIFSMLLCVLGCTVWLQTAAAATNVKQEYTTVATVEQAPNTIEFASIWDAGLQTYTHVSVPVYDSVLPVDLLRESDAAFLHEPEQRPYYGTLLPDGMMRTSSQTLANLMIIAEFTPEETCVPSQPVRITVTQVLLGDKFFGDSFWFCDHFTEDPPVLEKGKKYIASMQAFYSTHGAQIGTTMELVPMSGLFTTQYNADGQKTESDVFPEDAPAWEEVTDGFYETGHGKYWRNLVTSFQRLNQTIPVLPTDSLSLLPSFHEGRTTVTDGEAISAAQFRSGEAVCLVDEAFARMNRLQVGDTLPLSLYFANYRTPAGQLFGQSGGSMDFSLLNADGEIYAPFFERTYRIVGTYHYLPEGGASEIGQDTVIVPANSVTASDAGNIADFGPMMATTTSFEIENGTISACEAALAALPESAFLTVRYDDNGYSEIIAGLERAETLAKALFAIGAASLTATLLFLLYVFVARQKKRVAIERALGATKKQSVRSVLLPFVLVIFLASLLGGAAGVFAAEKTDTASWREKPSAFSTRYSADALQTESTGPSAEAEGSNSLAVSVGVSAGTALFAVLFSGIAGRVILQVILRADPLEDLAKRE